MISAIIVAAGKGLRAGTETPKQFVNINGNQILSLSVNTFKENNKIDEIIIVVAKNWHNAISQSYNKCKVVVGGKTRQESVKAGIESCHKDTSIVLIHDAARPFLSQSIINNCIKHIDSADAVAPILDTIDSLVEIGENQLTSINRTQIKSVQTPQCFKLSCIQESINSNFSSTDEIGLLLKKHPNSNIKFIKGCPKNFKITSKYDLMLAESLIMNK